MGVQVACCQRPDCATPERIVDRAPFESSAFEAETSQGRRSQQLGGRPRRDGSRHTRLSSTRPPRWNKRTTLYQPITRAARPDVHSNRCKPSGIFVASPDFGRKDCHCHQFDGASHSMNSPGEKCVAVRDCGPLFSVSELAVTNHVLDENKRLIGFVS